MEAGAEKSKIGQRWCLMLRIASIAAFALLLTFPDVSHVLQQSRPPDAGQQPIPASETIPVLPSFGQAPPGQPTGQPTDQTSSPQVKPAPGASAGPLTGQSRLLIIRYVSGEFAHMTTSLPAGKKGFHFKAGEPLDRAALQKEIRLNGAVLNAGDNVQITRITFGSQDMKVDINGGPKGSQSWRNRIQLSTDDGEPETTTTPINQGPVAEQPTFGATVTLDFGRPLPNMTADDLKSYLSVIFDFSKQRSAATTWAATLPPKVREAVEQKRAEVGMDPDEVLAAMGRPDRKVREQEQDGTDTEDWIYGHPPTKTVFVTFAGDKVVKVSQYPE